MSIITVWENQNTEKVLLAQLSDDPADGTPSEQIEHLSALSVYADYDCVDEDYTGPVPTTDPENWRWDGTEIVGTVPVPISVSPRQVRLLLLQQGLLSQVEATIATMDEATKITWQYAIDFQRNDPLLNSLATQLGLTNQQVDEFFIAASQL